MIKRINKVTETPTKNVNHIICVDCSGSMSSSLPKLREELKNKLSSLIDEKDKLSIIWFSGDGQADYVFDNYKITSAVELSNIKKGIDQYLKPIGATAFAKPLKLALQRVDESFLNNLVFMTDGYNNDCSINEVFENLHKIANKFDSSFFIEYGNYVDSQLIQNMAETTGGSVLNARDFESLAVQIETGLKALVQPKIEVTDIDSDYVFGTSNGQFIRYKVENGKALVAGDTEILFYGEASDNTDELPLIYGYFELGMNEKVEEILYKRGDVELIETYSKAYGKQKMLSFKEMVADMYFSRRPIFDKGYVADYKVDPNAYNVIEMLNDLSNGENEIYTYHSKFNYSKIGVSRIVKSGLDGEIKGLLAEADTVEEAQDILDKAVKPKFIPNDSSGCAKLSTLAFNTERANVNITVSLKGKVVNLPANQWGMNEYETHITRSYNIIKDGILNVTRMPVTLDGETRAKFDSLGLIVETLEPVNGKEVVLIDFSELPIINKSMLQSLNASEFTKEYLSLEEQKAAQKVFRYFDQQMNPPVSITNDEQKDAFLTILGITKNGFNPPSTAALSTDVYMAPNLECKFAGLSSLPSIPNAQKKRDENKKLNLADTMILKYCDMVNNLISLNAESAGETIRDLTKKVVAQKRSLEYNIANKTISLILSRGWFKDLEGFDDTKVELQSEFGIVDADLVFKEIEVKI
jgi:hypothetical protein